MSPYRKILVPVDGSETARRGLREAIRLARRQPRCSLVLVHVVDEFHALANVDASPYAADLIEWLRQGGRRILARSQALAKRHGVKAKTVMRETLGGPAANEIVRQARKLGADLIVLGTHGRRGVRRLVLGSDAEQVVRRSPVPVLLVRAKPS